MIAGSAFAVRLGHEAFSCLWLNPPYDQDDGGKRLEHSFLTTISRALAPGGLLVYIVPQARLAQSARYLATHYEGLRCYRFHDPEYAAFRQCVVLGSKRAAPTIAPDAKAQVEAWATEPLPELPPPGDTAPVYEMPALPAGPVTFASQFFEPEMAAAEARQRGLWTNTTLVERFWPAEDRSVRPLMPLRRGHLAVLIAAGFLNNILLEDGSRRVLVKGRVTKVSRPVQSTDPDVEVEREFLRTSVVMLDLGTGEFEDIEQGGQVMEPSSLNLVQFIEAFQGAITDAVVKAYPPLYSAHNRDELGFDLRRLGRRPMGAQADAIRACALSLQRHRATNLVGEMGTGKTTIGTAAATLAGFKRVLVLCPPHLVRKWQREVKATVPSANAVIVRTIGDLERVRHAGGWPLFVILSREQAKLSYRWKPAVATRHVVAASGSCSR